jgi:hypothetical protein
MATKSPEGITLLESKLLPFPFERVQRLIQAHRACFSEIHPHAKSVRQEADALAAEQQCESCGTNITVQTKLTVNPDSIEVEFSNGPATGSILTMYEPFPGGTRVSSESNFKSQNLNDDELAEFIQKYVDRSYLDNLQYLQSIG